MNVAQMAVKSSPAPLPYTQVESAFNTKYGRRNRARRLEKWLFRRLGNGAM
jgi:hypothetical protein